MSDKRLHLCLGIMYDLKTQLDEQGVKLTAKELRHYKRLIDSYNHLRIHGMLTDAEANRAGQRIVKEIAGAVKRKGK